MAYNLSVKASGFIKETVGIENDHGTLAGILLIVVFLLHGKDFPMAYSSIVVRCCPAGPTKVAGSSHGSKSPDTHRGQSLAEIYLAHSINTNQRLETYSVLIEDHTPKTTHKVQPTIGQLWRSWNNNGKHSSGSVSIFGFLLASHTSTPPGQALVLHQLTAEAIARPRANIVYF